MPVEAAEESAMIISASRRTDIPAYYAQWFVNRLKSGFVLVPDRYDAGRFSRIALTADVVDCIVFWSKNPAPMFDALDTITALGHRFLFQFTLTPYGKAIEPSLPAKQKLVDTFRQLGDMIGPDRLVWRYDPVLLDTSFSIQHHRDSFHALCHSLHAYTCRCVFSFVDTYHHLGRSVTTVCDEDRHTLAAAFAQSAGEYRLPLATCAETIDLESDTISHGSCIDRSMIETVIGSRLDVGKDKNQRPACRCVESVDIGTYDTCPAGCVYCYATRSPKRACRNRARHDPSSALMSAPLRGDERIDDRLSVSHKTRQMSLL